MNKNGPKERKAERSRVVRFGSFELALETGELRRHGVRVRLQGKPFQILSALLEEPGRVVSRDELRLRLWADNTFVDFEGGLNTAVNRLRLALNDSADKPVYVETLSRVGYRFIAPVILESRPEAIEPDETGVNQEEVVAAQDVIALQTLHPDPPVALVSAPIPVKQEHWKTITIFVLLAAFISTAIVLAISHRHTSATFHQVTFQKGFVRSARFAPDGSNIVYSAGWNGAPARLYLASTVSPEARDLGFEGASLESISSAAEMAIVAPTGGQKTYGLERAPMLGGTAHLISDSAEHADWGPDGLLAVVIKVRGNSVIEMPAGHRLYTSRGWISTIRISPGGEQIAFVEHLRNDDDAGRVGIVNRSGQMRILSDGWGSVSGLAWHPSGREVWFTAARSGVDRTLMAVNLNGRTRQVANVPGNIDLLDIGKNGSVLIARGIERMNMMIGNFKEHSERDISWLDWSKPSAITDDGKLVLFDESGEGGGKGYGTYIYRTLTGSAERLGDGCALDISDDGRWAITRPLDDPTKLVLVSVGQAIRKPISGNGIEYRWVKFFPNRREILAAGSDRNGHTSLYHQALPDGSPVLVKAEFKMGLAVIDPDARFVLGDTPEWRLISLDLTSGAVATIEAPKGTYPIRFVSPEVVLVGHIEDAGISLNLLNLKAGRSTFYERITPVQAAGMEQMSHVQMAHDLQTYVYARMQSLSDLFVVNGWA